MLNQAKSNRVHSNGKINLNQYSGTVLDEHGCNRVDSTRLNVLIQDNFQTVLNQHGLIVLNQHVLTVLNQANSNRVHSNGKINLNPKAVKPLG